jgi:hypothetical protein
VAKPAGLLSPFIPREEATVRKTAQIPGFTFAVDEVVPATKRLPERRMHEALKRMLGSEVESCCDYHGTVIKDLDYQPLLAAVYQAFSEHRPLALTPDAVWITIAQGVAHHMTIHGERLRSRLVAHQGKLDLAFECRGWVEGSPENPWTEAFDSWAGQIRDHVGHRVHDTLICDFSTSGPVERAASQIVMMDVFERYFEYLLYAVCGIPSITLEGTTDDWQHLSDKAAALEVFDLDWWLADLLPICNQFIRASRGDVDLGHWQGICKLRSAYGGDIINGWVARLFPYLRAFTNGPCNRRNPIFETGEGFTTSDAPPGLARVPFRWRNAETNRERQMEAIGGLVGVTQDPQTLALRPKVGWAVREAEKMDVLLARLAAEHTTFPGLRTDDKFMWPPDMARFYHWTDGAELFDRGHAATCRIVAADDIEPLDWGETPEVIRLRLEGRIWHRFAWLADGSWLAINLDQLRPDPRQETSRKRSNDRQFHAICRGMIDTQGRPGQNPVVALSFTELLEQMLNRDGLTDWLDPQFVGYGDAEQYTRRD